MFAVLKQTTTAAGIPADPEERSPRKDKFPGELLMPSPEIGLDYAYTIDHYSHLLSSPEDLPPPPHSSRKFIKKMANAYDSGFELGWQTSEKSTNEVYLDASSMDCSAEISDNSGKVNEPSVEESNSGEKKSDK